MDPAGTAPPRAIYMDLQPDWRAQRLETCWLNVYERSVRFSGGDPPSVAVESHVNTSFQLPLQGPEISATAPTTGTTAAHLVEITKRERDWMEVHADGLARVVFQAPRDTLDVFAPTPSHHGVDEQHDTEPITHRRVVRPQLLSVDVAMDEQHVVAGGADGKCTLWDLSLGSQPRPLVGHLLDVTRSVFFPSSKVVLTASLDFSLRIWSVESARCAAVLKGHSGGVTDVAVVGRGRNVVSSASDGSVHLWCCGNQQIVAAWNNEDASAAQCLALLDDAKYQVVSQAEAQADRANEFETEAKVLFAGLENGKVLGIDVRARDLALSIQATAGVVSCAATGNDGTPVVVTGGEDGMLMTWDLRQTSVPLHVVSRSAAAIHRIVIPYGDRGSVWTAQGDGACSNWSHLLGPAESVPPFTSTELTGPQYDPVRDLAVAPSTGRVFTACRDGLVREYIPHFMA